jgi:hypothetical protein
VKCSFLLLLLLQEINPMMKTIALFRYHKNLDICKQRLEFFHQLNPNIEIHGLFGGGSAEYISFTKELSLLQSNYLIKDVPDEWKWKNFDLVLKRWYTDFGKTIEFDRLVLLEWDFIMLDSVERMYSHIEKDEVAFTGLIDIERIQQFWYWVSNEDRRAELNTLLDWAKDKYNYKSSPKGILCPGLMLNRKYLNAMLNIDLPEDTNDEVRLPIYAQIAEIPMQNNGFLRTWFSASDDKYFNCANKSVRFDRLKKELSKPNGRRAFHPYRDQLLYNSFEPLIKKNTQNPVSESIPKIKVENALKLRFRLKLEGIFSKSK